ncbi:uncharacterized protein BKA55DRAFT_547314 [Fusarium redolens]|uniref:Uncharacterized protein n=1 Tax=Fusarium redolens TaxID=48865 RepID=A0A9P9FW77_FUSRE|nr:uncharacterized protein BKA55DRAFT_547314 [Fusarium redolens]KAH7204887.1 hypothetical protein BKA55DRAFT_547314 [Fusarium redolens]
MAAKPVKEPVYKRQRVAQACQPYHTIKAKAHTQAIPFKFALSNPPLSVTVRSLSAAAMFSQRHGLNNEDGHNRTSLRAIHKLQDAINGYKNLVHQLLSKKKQDHFNSKELHKTVKDQAKKALNRIISITDSRTGDIDSISDLD